MEFLKEFRAQWNDDFKFVEFLSKYAKPDEEIKTRFVQKMRIAKIKKDSLIAKQTIKTLLNHMLLKANINFVVENLPNVATNIHTNLPEHVTARSMHDTLGMFGNVKDVVVFRNNAYAWFLTNKEAKRTHKLLNQMQVDNNIITTMCVC